MATTASSSRAGDRLDDASIGPALRHSVWTRRAGCSGAPGRVVDSAAIGELELVWVDLGDRTVLLVRRFEDEDCRAIPTVAVVESLAGEQVRRTSNGGALSWVNRPRDGLTVLSTVETTSSNDVFRVSAGGAPAVLKLYRVAGEGERETAILRALESTGLVPQIAAQLVRRDWKVQVVALLLEAVAGETLDVPLRLGLERARRDRDACLTSQERAALRRVHDATATLHRELARRLPPCLGHAPERSERFAADITAIRACARHLSEHRLLDMAAAVAEELEADASTQSRPAHGDLHLSNVIVDGDDVRFIDMADVDSCPEDDFAALRRGVECMCLDLQVDRVGRSSSTPERVAADLKEVALRAVGSGDPTGLLAPLSEAAAESSHDVWDRWPREAADVLAGPLEGRATQLAYLCRLAHDLRYHLDHENHYYANLAWWQLTRIVLDGRVENGGGE